MGDSGDSSSGSDCGSPQPIGKSTSKVFVWLKGKAKCTPRGNPWVLLNREGRVKDIKIGGNYSSAKIKELVKENFAGLAAVDLDRIRLYKSTSHGSKMEKVYRGIPDAKEIFRIYGKGSSNSRRIYMVLQHPRNGGSNPNPESIPTPGVTNPNHPSLPSVQPNSNPPSTNQSHPSHHPEQPNSDPPSTNQFQPSIFLAQPNSNPPSTNQSQTSLSSALLNSNPSSLSQQSTTHPNPSSSQTSVTNSVIQPGTSSDEARVASGVVNQVDLTLPGAMCTHMTIFLYIEGYSN